MNEIDQVSQALGKLLADSETRQRQSADQYKQLGEIKDMVSDLCKTVAVVANQQVAHAESDERRFRGIEGDMSGVKSKVSGMEMSAAVAAMSRLSQ